MSQQKDLHALLAAKQEVLLAKSGLADQFSQPTSKGDSTEENWASVLDEFLPNRYTVSRQSHLIDANGESTSNIDIIIHDGHFCPLFFEADGHKYIPAEGVYAIFEVKQELTREDVFYAAESAETMRGLRRTNASIKHIGGVTKPGGAPFEPLAGILTTRSSWNPPLGDPLVKVLGDLSEPGQLNLGCALTDGAFLADYSQAQPTLTRSEQGASLVFFLMQLYTELQKLGTVPAIELSEYARSTESGETSAQ